MEKSKKLLVYGVIIATIVIFFVLFFFFFQTEKVDQIAQQEESITEKVRDLYLDAPKPDMDPEEVLKLWPDLQNPPKYDPDEVERQWIDFARKYPNNFYIPTKYLNLTEEQLQERQKQLEIFTDLEARIASLKAKYKNVDTSVEGPDTPKEPTVSPEDQRQYFKYKIHELQSRIELVEYWLENQKDGLDPQQIEIANQDLSQWKKELEEYKNLLKNIP